MGNFSRFSSMDNVADEYVANINVNVNVSRKEKREEEEGEEELAKRLKRGEEKDDHDRHKLNFLYEKYGQDRWLYATCLFNKKEEEYISVPKSCILRQHQHDGIGILKEDDLKMYDDSDKYYNHAQMSRCQPDTHYVRCLPGLYPILKHSWYAANWNGQFDYYYLINTYGSFTPWGGIVLTPDRIRVPLKIHQQRSLFEMRVRETFPEALTHMNTFVYSDRIGSGKSLTLLSLIATAPHVNINDVSISQTRKISERFVKVHSVLRHDTKYEVSSSLIIVPHTLFSQWMMYIRTQTGLTVLGIDSLRCIQILGKTSESIVESLNRVNIVLLKSTMVKAFRKLLASIPDIDPRCISLDNDTLLCIRDYLERGPDALNEMFNITEEDVNCALKVFGRDIIYDTYSRTSPTSHLTGYITHFTDLKDEFNQFAIEISNMMTIRDSNRDNPTVPENDALGILKTAEQNLVDLKSRVKLDHLVFPYRSTKKILARGIIFQRVIVDEADTIIIPKFPDIIGKVTWLVSASLANLLSPMGISIASPALEKYRRVSTSNDGIPRISVAGIRSRCGMVRSRLLKLFSDVRYENFKDYFLCSIVKNHTQFVEDSLKLPDPEFMYVKCYTPNTITLLFDALSTTGIDSKLQNAVISSLNAGDITNAARLLQDRIHLLEIQEEERRQRLADAETDAETDTDTDTDTTDSEDSFADDDGEDEDYSGISQLIENKKYSSRVRRKLTNVVSKNTLKCSSLLDVAKLAKVFVQKLIANYQSKNDMYIEKIKLAEANSAECSQLSGSTFLDPSERRKLNTKIYNYKSSIRDMNLFINANKEHIERLRKSIDLVSEKISPSTPTTSRMSMEDQECPICYEPLIVENSYLLLSCCMSTICVSCYANMVNSSHHTCSFCRATMSTKTIICVKESPDEEAANSEDAHSTAVPTRTEKALKEEELPSKLKFLIDTIQEHPTKRVLIFSKYLSIFPKVQADLKAIGIESSFLKGTQAHINTVLQSFREGKTRILLLSADNFGAGINLVETEMIFLYHRMDKALEEQIVGRAHRLGLNHPLRIYKLCYQNEYEKYDAPILDSAATADTEHEHDNETLELEMDMETDEVI
jgi:hypothetical protein